MQRLPVKTQCFVHFEISCELGTRKKWDEGHMQHLPVKTQCFLQFGISCELGNRKNGPGSTKVALTCEKTMFCAAWNQLRIRDWKKWDGRQTGGIYLWKANVLHSLNGIRSAACSVWCFHNRVCRTKRCEHIRARQYTLCFPSHYSFP